MSIRTPADLQGFLTEAGIEAEILTLTAETPTVTAAAEALGISVDQIVKTVLFLVNGDPVAVLANGTRRVDAKKLARYLGISPNRVKLANGEAVIAHLGYAPGTVPPVGHVTPVKRLIVSELAALSPELIVYAGGGGLHEMLKLTVATLIGVTQARIADVLEDR
jgi:prolyl-tRNA editing enzyme YbaK/EbsC (Cys-tRNA(Pro) deacylase)